MILKRPLGARLIGLIEGLLLLRLVALLFAARPDNPFFELLFLLTAPLVAPFTALDRIAHQPQWGARLELATLAAMLMVIGIAGIWQWNSRSHAATIAEGAAYAQSQRPDRQVDH